MKFLTKEKFTAAANQWVRDGADITSVGRDEHGQWINVIQIDHCEDELVLYYEKEMFDDDTNNVSGE